MKYTTTLEEFKHPSRDRSSLLGIRTLFPTVDQTPLKVARAGPKILLVDDDPLVLFAVKGMLVRLSCDVLTATSGSQAIEIVASTNRPGATTCIELAIIDANMPVMNGYDTAALLTKRMDKAEVRPLHLVCLSAQDSAAHVELCRRSGMELVSIGGGINEGL